MKKLLFFLALFLGAVPMVNAQETSSTDEPTVEEYETLIENYYKIKFREMAFESLELTEDEIIKFDPLYNEYTSRKMEIADRRYELIEKYRDEMMEDDDAEEKEDERADFIENYWETKIQEMELKKDFFDRFEDIVSNEKAINFFLLEEKAQSRMEENTLIEIVPMMIRVKEYDPMMKEKREDASMNWNKKDDEMSNDIDADRMANNTDWTNTSNSTETTEKNWSSDEMTTTEGKDWSNKNMTNKTNQNWDSKDKAAHTSNANGLNAFNEWIEKEGNGVAINHRYTSSGLEKLVSAIWTVAKQHDIDASAWSAKKDRILSITKELQRDPSSTDHADIAREAFEITAVMINAIQDEKGTDKTTGYTSKVSSAAKAINPDRLMTKQANDIYAFFSYAQQALHELSDVANYRNSSASNQNK